MILRGLWRRRWLSLIVLIVAVVPVVAGSLGPMYTDAARTTLMRETLDKAVLDHRGWRVTSVTDNARVLVEPITAPFLLPPIEGAELLSPDDKATKAKTYPLMWIDGQCDHVTLIEGRCPGAANEIMVTSASGFKVGGTVKLALLSNPSAQKRRLIPLRVVGVYKTDAADPIWYGRSLFPQTAGVTEGNGDPLLTVPDTQVSSGVGTSGNVSGVPGAAWTSSAIIYIDRQKITGDDLALLESVHADLRGLGQSGQTTTVFSYMDDTLKAVHLRLDSLSVPTTLVTLQLVALGWLLLFLTVRDLVAARAQEIALARLRGLSTLRIWAFGLSEPAFLLLAALPLGIATSFAVVRRMSETLLRNDLEVTVDGFTVLCGVAAVFGGLLATALAARQTVTQPVVEQWRRTPRSHRRAWVTDAVVLVITAVGLAELLAGGVITDATGQRASALIAPGLLAVALAMIARRILPLACRALFRLTRTHGNIGAFLAMRQISRGSATASTVVVLAAGLGLAVFAVAAWSVTSRNYQEVARVHNGAETVFVVPRSDVATLRKISAAIPGTAPVIVTPGPPATVATDPALFAAVALWRPSYGNNQPLSRMVAKLSPRVAAPRVMLSGDRIRAHISTPPLPDGWSALLYADFRVAGETRPAAIPLARPDARIKVHEWGLPRGCLTAPCELRGLRMEVTGSTGTNFEDRPSGSAVLTKLETRSGGRWSTVDAGLDDPSRWTSVSAEDGGLPLSFDPNFGVSRPETFPDPLPGLSSGTGAGQKLPGLDDVYFSGYESVATARALPGLNAPGVVVDLETADRIAYGYSPRTEFQIWAAPGRGDEVREALRRDGVPVLTTRTVDDLASGYVTQGPGLALLLLIVSAGVAALLALGRAVLALHTAARRRTYEMAALEAAGARARSLRVALLLEQAITLSWGALTGVLAGLVAAWAALPRVPEFAETPVTPTLDYSLVPVPVVVVACAVLVLSMLAAAVTSELLLRGVRVDQLREAPA
jgi:putative ABC transport system permease protein